MVKKKQSTEELIDHKFLSTIDMSKDYSPVQLSPDEKPVKIMQCAKGYWVMLPDGNFLKDEKRQLVIISPVDAKKARARYKLNFAEEVNNKEIERKENKIQTEIGRLKKQVDDRLKEDISKLKDILLISGRIISDNPIHNILVEQVKLNDPHRVTLAKELATDELVNTYNMLLKMQSQGHYDQLYQHYFQDGLPMVASYNNSTDLKALKQSWSADKVFNTIDELKDKSHLYNVAKFNIEKLENR